MMAPFEALKETMFSSNGSSRKVLTAQLRMHGNGKAKAEEETWARQCRRRQKNDRVATFLAD